MQITSEIEQKICRYIVQSFHQKKSKCNYFDATNFNVFGCKFLDIFNQEGKKYYIGWNEDDVFLQIRKPHNRKKYKDKRKEIRATTNTVYPQFIQLIQSIYFIRQLYDNRLILILRDWENNYIEKEFNPSDCIPYYFKDNSILEFVQFARDCEVLPTEELIQLCHHKFRTPEQIRFRNNSIISWIAISVSFLIGILSPWLMTEFSKTSIEPTQLETIINAIPERVDEVRLNQEQMDSITSIIKNMSQHNGKTKNAKP